jgi:hypothetical protein
MPWGRLDDQANRSPKLLALSDPAWRMWGCGLIYCNEELTDGFIPAHMIETFGVKAAGKKKIAKELCTKLVPGKDSLWHEVPGGYQVHDYLDWNDSREEVLKKRASGKDRQQRYRERKGDASHHASSDASRDALRNASQTPLPMLGLVDVTRHRSGTYRLGNKYHSPRPGEERTSDYSAESAGAPLGMRQQPKTAAWTIYLAICHTVIEDDPRHPENWPHELKARMLNQGIDANDQGPKGDKGKLFQRVLEACIEQRKFRKGDGGIVAWRYRHQRRQDEKQARSRRVG